MARLQVVVLCSLLAVSYLIATTVGGLADLPGSNGFVGGATANLVTKAAGSLIIPMDNNLQV
jgi:hypothetical protein